jgi:spermidine synthase
VIISDLPDPNNVSLARLYSREFYKLIASHLSRTGVFLTQATSPFFSNKAFWCINNTVKETGMNTYPYHVYIPSFGDWGFVMASRIRMDPGAIKIRVPTRYVEDRIIGNFFVFAKDLIDKSPQSSTLDRPMVLSYYLEGWKYWN